MVEREQGHRHVFAFAQEFLWRNKHFKLQYLDDDVFWQRCPSPGSALPFPEYNGRVLPMRRAHKI